MLGFLDGFWSEVAPRLIHFFNPRSFRTFGTTKVAVDSENWVLGGNLSTIKQKIIEIGSFLDRLGTKQITQRSTQAPTQKKNSTKKVTVGIGFSGVSSPTLSMVKIWFRRQFHSHYVLDLEKMSWDLENFQIL